MLKIQYTTPNGSITTFQEVMPFAWGVVSRYPSSHGVIFRNFVASLAIYIVWPIESWFYHDMTFLILILSVTIRSILFWGIWRPRYWWMQSMLGQPSWEESARFYCMPLQSSLYSCPTKSQGEHSEVYFCSWPYGLMLEAIEDYP